MEANGQVAFREAVTVSPRFHGALEREMAIQRDQDPSKF